MSKQNFEPIWRQNRIFRQNFPLFDQLQQLDTLMSLYSLTNYVFCLENLF